MNGYNMNHRPTGKSTKSSTKMQRIHSSSYAEMANNPNGYHGNIPPPPPHHHLNNNNAETPYAQWMPRGREMDFVSVKRNDNDISRWKHHPYDEVSGPTRYSWSLEDYYHTTSYHHSMALSNNSGYPYYPAARSAAAPFPTNGYSAESVGDIFRSPTHRESSYITPPDGDNNNNNMNVPSPSPQMVTPTRAMGTEDTYSRKSLLSAPPMLHQQNHSSSHIMLRPNDNFHYEGRNEESPRKKNATTKGRSSLSSSSLIWHLEENDIVCGRGAPSLFQRGNQAFRDLIHEHQTVYLCSKRSDKPRLAWKIFDIVSSRGGRFVRRNKGHHYPQQQQEQQSHHPNSTGGGDTGKGTTMKGSSSSRPAGQSSSSSSSFAWEQLSDKQAYEKICQSLREGAPEFRRRMMFASVNKRQSDEDGCGGRDEGEIDGDDNDSDGVENHHSLSSSSRPGEYGNANAAAAAAGGDDERRSTGKEESAFHHPV